MSNARLISQIEEFVRRDPARRGLIGADGAGPGRGELARAADLFLRDDRPTGVGLVTGFFIPLAASRCPEGVGGREESVRPPGHAETDGPPGTVVLADVLSALGVPTSIITDEYCEPVVRACISDGFCEAVAFFVSPGAVAQSAAWRAGVLRNSMLRRLSHLVCIERVGPGYELLEPVADLPEPVAELPGSEIAQRHANAAIEWRPGHCCNMRGESIEAFSADLHRLIDDVRVLNPNLKVVGIGDGGNEIGMGRFSREELLKRISGPHVDRVPCRISADATIVAGVSNWGAYALAAAIAVQHGRVDLLERHTAESQWRLLERIVNEAGAVDGVTRKSEPTVDGLPFLTQIQPWVAIRERLGLRP
jgi:hypothetical protein